MQKSCKRFISIGCIAVCLSVLAGCGPNRAQREGRAVVSGTVTFNGKPVPGGIITFLSPSGATAGGMLRSAGNYYIEDAPIGKNKVTVDPEAIKPELGSRYVQVPPKYLKPDMTDLKVTIEAGENRADFELK
jgi:hypothetical protein